MIRLTRSQVQPIGLDIGSDSVKTGVHQEPGNVSTPRTAVAKTQYGKVRGFVDGGVLTFKGVTP